MKVSFLILLSVINYNSLSQNFRYNKFDIPKFSVSGIKKKKKKKKCPTSWEITGKVHPTS